jgi:outer membrane protein assembly factor BamB
MTTNTLDSTPKPLRLWPGIAIAIVHVLLLVFGPLVSDDGTMVALLGGALCTLLIVVWWLVFSRAPWLERIGALALMAAAAAASKSLVHVSVAGAGQGYLVYIMALQLMVLALVAWAYLTRHAGPGTRRLALAAAVLIALLPMTVWRTSGIGGGGGLNAHWRWTPTPEEILLARGAEELKPLPPAPAVEAPTSVSPAAAPVAPVPAAPPDAKTETPAPTAKADDRPAEWPGFRGPNRDSVVRGVRIHTDWATTPPAQIWRRPVGPGWSSFSVRGDLLYTQEQRGNEELISAYRVSTGDPVWRHADPVRFYESNGGAGPRGTPTIYGDRVFAMGATGILNALDARTGRKIWSHDTYTDANRTLPYWGNSSSPLVVDDVVIVGINGVLAGYDAASGERRWTGPRPGASYSSPHLVTLDGVRQVVIQTSPGAVSVNPADGTKLWEHKWEGGAIIQPGVTEDGDLLVHAMSATGGVGTRRLSIKHEGGAWTLREKWTSNGLKPYFNDYVIHKGHAYGFDNNILACIDLADGARKWKGGRYGNGQMLLLADQDLLLVTSEEGELALVRATTDKYEEIAKLPVLNAKTWNHPVIIGGILLVRNGEEMAAFRLPLQGAAATDAR